MRGYFAIGVERISKPGNVGNLLRSAHAFGASFFFAVAPAAEVKRTHSDTSRAPDHLPVFIWPGIETMALPKGCALVGIELTEEAIDLPSFRHPMRAAYILGPERGSLSPQMLGRCDHVVRIPTAFCVNVATAGAVVMYDRVRLLGRHAPRPVTPGGPIEALPEPIFGSPLVRSAKRKETPDGAVGRNTPDPSQL